jgi:glyoxylase-like metal-dependent hydrolase (beta-lactamase superfamily II)
MIVERTEHPSWLSNSYLVADRPGGHGVLIDSNGVSQPLLDRAERDDIAVTHILLTHHHADHVAEHATLRSMLGVPVVASAVAAEHVPEVDETIEDGDELRSGDLRIGAIATPGHCAGHLAFLVDGTECFTADVLFRGTVGGTRGGSFEELRASIMRRLMPLPRETRVHPGHSAPSTIGVEWEANPFVRVWRGLDPEADEPCTVGDEEARLVVWGPDYDGGHKAWVRFPERGDAIVAGSRVRR